MIKAIIAGTVRGKTHKARLDMLERLRNKGAAWQSQSQAESLIKTVNPMLTEIESRDLSIAHGHYKLGEGSSEFYEVVNKLITKYSNARP